MQEIISLQNPIIKETTALHLPGMCFTVEPGLYCDNWGGVRIENTVTIVEQNSKMQIKSLTKAKLDDNLIDKDLLTDEEKIWLENYQKHAIG